MVCLSAGSLLATVLWLLPPGWRIGLGLLILALGVYRVWDRWLSHCERRPRQQLRTEVKRPRYRVARRPSVPRAKAKEPKSPIVM